MSPSCTLSQRRNTSYSTLRKLSLPFDVWVLIFATVDDTTTLASCAQVSRTLWDAATRKLYRSVVVTESDRGDGKISPSWAFTAISAHVQFKQYVRNVTHEVTGPWTVESHPRASGTAWTTLLPSLPRLTSYSLVSFSMGEPVSKALITSVVDALLQCPKLTSVEWNCLINEDTLPIIMRLNMLRDFSVQRLTTIAYFRLDRFLMSMPHLEGLHLHTFGAMHIQELAESHRLDRLKRLTLGKSSLLLRPQVMFLLSRTTHLERLDIYYYSFLFDAWTVERAEPEFTGLARLRDLTVRHGRLEDEQEFADVVSWIATLSGATQLQSLTIHSVYGVFAFSAALANMIAKHSSLRSFFATHILLSSQDFLSILRSCSLLEDASFLMEKGDFEYLLALAKDPASSAFRGKLSITDYCDVLTVAWHKDIVV